MNCLDLFAGAGGLTEGFVRAGFNMLAHIEKEKPASLTLKTRISLTKINANQRTSLFSLFNSRTSKKRRRNNRFNV